MGCGVVQAKHETGETESFLPSHSGFYPVSTAMLGKSVFPCC